MLTSITLVTDSSCQAVSITCLIAVTKHTTTATGRKKAWFLIFVFIYVGGGAVVDVICAVGMGRSQKSESGRLPELLAVVDHLMWALESESRPLVTELSLYFSWIFLIWGYFSERMRARS